MFLGFYKRTTFVKMKKLGKKNSLTSSWEGPFLFMKYLDGNGFMGQDEGGRICVIKGEKK
jgi:hypothetical protein